MATSLFMDTYQRYKRQSDEIAEWLVENADKAGYKLMPEESQRAVNQAPSVRLKGKARKEAKRNIEHRTPQPAIPTGPTYRVKVSEFTKLAQSIAHSSKPKIRITSKLMGALQRVIAVRRDFSRYYERQTDSVSNSNHEYFVSTLSKVKSILESAPQEGTRKSTHKRTKATNPMATSEVDSVTESTVSLENRFSGLKFEESNETDDDDEPVGSVVLGPTTSKPASRTIEYDGDGENDINNGELDFAIFCLHGDYQSMQHYLETIWKDYAESKVSLIEASVITNTAFYRARKAQEQIHESFLRLEGRPDLNTILYLHIWEAQNNESAPEPSLSRMLQNGPVEVSTLLYIPAQLLLSSYCKNLNLLTLQMPNAGSHNQYKLQEGHNEMTAWDKYKEDKAILEDVMSDFHFLALSEVSFPGEDELTIGLRAMHMSKQVPVWLSFAFQVWLDIRHVLRESVCESRRELLKTGLAWETALEPLSNGTLIISGEPGVHEIQLKSHLTWVNDWIKTDIMVDIKQFRLRNQSEALAHIEPFSLLDRHPTACGLLEFWLTLGKRDLGSSITSDVGTVLLVTHLYNALRQTQSLNIKWQEIEEFISLMSAEAIFVGGLPTNIDACLNHMYLALGISIRSFARDRASGRSQRGRLVLSKTGMRNWVKKAPIAKIFERCFFGKEPAAKWSMPNLEDHLNKTHQSKFKVRREKSHRLSSLQLLVTLWEALSNEYQTLTYDYLGLHLLLQDFLTSLRAELLDELKEIFGPNYLKYDPSGLSLILYLLGHDDKTQMITWEPVRVAMRARAGAFMKAFIEKHPQTPKNSASPSNMKP